MLKVLPVNVGSGSVVGDHVAGFPGVLRILAQGLVSAGYSDSDFGDIVPDHRGEMSNHSSIGLPGVEVVVADLVVPLLAGLSPVVDRGGVAPLPVEVLAVLAVLGFGRVLPGLVVEEVLGPDLRLGVEEVAQNDGGGCWRC